MTRAMDVRETDEKKMLGGPESTNFLELKLLDRHDLEKRGISCCGEWIFLLYSSNTFSADFLAWI